MARTKPIISPIDWTAPAAKGLLLAFPFWERSGNPRDVASGKAGTLSGGVSWASGPSGPCLSFGGSNGLVAVSPPPSGVTNELSLSLWVYYTNASQNAILIEQEPVNAKWTLFLNAGNLILGGNASDTTCQITAPSANQWHHICSTHRQNVPSVSYADRRLYVDGKLLITTQPLNDTRDFTYDASQIDIGYGRDFSSYAFSGLMDDVRLYNRVLAPSEVAAIYADTWAIYGRPSVRRFFVPAGGTTAYHLAGGTGAFVETAGSAGLVVARRLAGGSGAFVETAGSAGLATTRRLAAATGTFAETAGNAGFQVTAASFLDTFGGSATVLESHTSDSGHTWTRNTGAGHLSTTGLTPASAYLNDATAGYAGYNTSYAPAAADCDGYLSVKVKSIVAHVAGVLLNSGSSFLVGYQCRINVDGAGNSTYEVYRANSPGGYLPSLSGPTVNVGDAFTLRYALRGNVITLTHDGTLVGTFTDANGAIPAGIAGLTIAGSAADTTTTGLHVSRTVVGNPLTATVSGPSSGASGVESTAFTVALSRTSVGPTVVSLASTGGGDVFHATMGGSSVSSITIPDGSSTGTFYLLPGSGGSRTITPTIPAAVFTPTSLSYTASGATTYHLAGGTGTFAETAGSAGLIVGRKLAAGTGTFTETGGTAALLQHRVLAAAPGTFTETGGTAALSLHHGLAAGAGTFTETPGTASFLVHRVLASGTGVFTETPGSAGLIYTAAGSTAYHLAGGTGSFTETGGSAAFTVARKFAGATGTFTETPGTASLGRALRLAAATGGFTESPGLASLLVRRQFAGGTGVFVETGGTAALTYTAAPTPRSPDPRRALVTRGGPDPTQAVITRGGPDPTQALVTRGGPDPTQALWT